jgi:hypothetical protein
MMDRVTPAQPQRFLEEAEDGEVYEVADPTKNSEPAELAAWIIESLDIRAGAELPDYLPTRDWLRGFWWPKTAKFFLASTRRPEKRKRG